MSSFAVLHYSFSPKQLNLTTRDYKVLALKSANFGLIPKWISLSGRPAEKSETIRPGHVENLHLVSLAKNGYFKEVREFLKEMDDAGISVDTHTFKSLFETCGDLGLLSEGRFFHYRLRKIMENPPDFLENSLLKMYCDSGSLSDAQKLFDKMLAKNFTSWLYMISANAHYGFLDVALNLFIQMQKSGYTPNRSIFVNLLRSLSDPSHLELGKMIHSHVIRIGFSSDTTVEMEILNMYVKCRYIVGAELVLNQMAEKNPVACTGLMVGYTQANKLDNALSLFHQMVKDGIELDEFVFSIILKVCAGLNDLKMGLQIHAHSIKLGLDSHVSVGTPIVVFYVKCASSSELARRAFDQICEPNDVSWSAMISGYCQTGKFDESLRIFRDLRSRDMALNSLIYTSIFQACSALCDGNSGAQTHADAVKRGFVSYLYGESAMITMYSKCGRLDYAVQAFESLLEPDAVAWTAMISAYAYHGSSSEGLMLFDIMQKSGIKPNAITFIAVLSACSHSGLVNEGRTFLDSMRSVYAVEPTIDHYICMIDVYSRAGMLQNALELIKTMPFKPDSMSWKSLLGGCWTHRNLEIGKIAAENLTQLDPDDTSCYVIMFNLNALFGKFEEAGCYRKMMVERNLKKELSCSWISVKGKVHRFIVGDRHHARTEEIYKKLEEFKLEGEERVVDEEDSRGCLAERENQLLDHSERLAIAFGLISVPNNAPVLVFKNIRACRDCHEFAKSVSMETGREIIVRDSSRFHHFSLGKCSCNDYW